MVYSDRSKYGKGILHKMSRAGFGCRSRMLRKFAYPIMLIGVVALFACTTETPPGPRPVRIVSWGGLFQQALLNDWWQPASEACGIKFEADSWNGDYGALSARIRKGINDWDLVHVEAHYVENPSAPSLFERFDLNLTSIDPELKNPFAVPILEYGYVLAYRKDILHIDRQLGWKDFFDVQHIQGRRGLRDVPVGNIEIALVSLGRNLNQVLYDPKLTRSQVEEQVEDALHRLESIRSDIIWWNTGDQLQTGLTSGDMAMAAAWSGRVWSAYKQLCGNGTPPQDCKLQANEHTSLVSTDWWVIPKNAPDLVEAKNFLKCMYSNPAALKGAVKFSLAQGYSVPIKGTKLSDKTAAYYLKMGSSSNPDKLGRIQESFWGKNYDWIAARWRRWRVSE